MKVKDKLSSRNNKKETNIFATAEPVSDGEQDNEIGFPDDS
jgi:hypothetical protein